MIGPLLKFMLVFKKALDQHCANEEECGRLAVWVHALMCSFWKASQEGVMDAGSLPLVDAATTALQQLKTLVDKRLDRTGGRWTCFKDFWVSKEFKEGLGRAEKGLHDALSALLTSVSIETKRDVRLVLARAKLLPQMAEKLDAVNDQLALIVRNNDSILALIEEDRDERRREHLERMESEREQTRLAELTLVELQRRQSH